MESKDPTASTAEPEKAEPFKFPEPVDQDVGKDKGCWVKTYMRGMGKKISKCQGDEELAGRKCFDKCKDDFTGWGNTCYKNCADQTSKGRTTAFCPRPKNEGR